MTQVTARVPDELAESLDAAAAMLKRSRAALVRQALEQYLENFDDLSVALDRLRDPADPVLDWDEVRRELLGSDQAQRVARPGTNPPTGPDSFGSCHRRAQ